MPIRKSALLMVMATVAPLAAQERPRGPLADSIAPLFADRMWRRATWGALVVSLTRGDTLLSYRADRRFIPASNAKLFTTAAALHYLGTEFRFVTVLFADGRVRNGELLGDLVLYGTGDPSFELDTASLAILADSVALSGIRRIRGDIIGDASFLGGELTAPGWQPDQVTSTYAARPAALGTNENRIRVTVEPGPRRGAAARARIEPETDYYAVASVVITGRPGSRTVIRIRRGRAHGIVELSGTIAADALPWSRTILVERPAEFAASLLRRLIEARGVTVSGITRAVVDDAPTRAHTMLMRSASRGDAFAGAIAVHRSPPLDELVTMINHRSHNLSAELAFRTIGRMQGGTGTFASGARAVARFLTDEAGIPASAVQVRDGSGLSLLDEASPRSIVQLLAYMRRSAEGEEFFASLPLVGEGMLSRMTDTPAAGRLRAKTGTLAGVSALAGYVTTAGGEELAFSIIVNGARSIDEARLVQDSIGVRLSLLDRTRVAPAESSRAATPLPRSRP